MNQRFSHLLLTLFNVRIAFGRGSEAPTVEWLTHRFELFDNFCYPSIRGQTNQNFKWVVLFDRDTPKEFRDRIDQYAQWDNFHPYYIEDFESFKSQGLMDVVLENSRPGSDYLITTRLDNDDALSRGYLQAVQDCFCAQEFEFVNFPQGYALSVNKWRQARLYSKDEEFSNPFISLIESKREGKFRTIWGCGPHDRLPFVGKISQVASRERWLQVVHGKNVKNVVGFSVRAPICEINGVFALGSTFENANENRYTIAFDNGKRKVLRLFSRTADIAKWYLRKMKTVVRSHRIKPESDGENLDL